MIVTFAIIATIAAFLGIKSVAILMVWLMVLASQFEFFTPAVPDEFSKVAAYSPIPRERSSS